MHTTGILLACMAAAIGYGIVHDLVTTRVCVEYFTVDHPPVFGTSDPTILAIGWGILATWWVGLLLGIPLAFISRTGSRPKRSVASLIRPMALLLCTIAMSAFAAGVLGWHLASSGAVFLVGPIADKLSRDRHVPYLSVLWAHSTSYLIGLVSGGVLVFQVWRSRRLVH